jgi:putative endonuclease
MSFTDKQKVGNLGEEIGCKFLKKHGFLIKDRNYRKKWGEIDIIAEKDNLLHFIEVKTVSRPPATTSSGEVGRGETDHNPEENVHLWKQKRLARAIQTYLLEKKIPEETEWQIDIMAIFLDFKTRKAKIRMTENVILG